MGAGGREEDSLSIYILCECVSECVHIYEKGEREGLIVYLPPFNKKEGWHGSSAGETEEEEPY